MVELWAQDPKLEGLNLATEGEKISGGWKINILSGNWFFHLSN
jgi:hypothetical protein